MDVSLRDYGLPLDDVTRPPGAGSAAGARPAAVLIAGPTASGKSALALAMAREAGGVVINADSMQVYGVLRVLTARPDAQEEASAPHRLYGHVPPSQPYSVAQWLREVAAEIAAARAAGLLPVVVGGTGLYFKALVEGLSPIPEIDPEIRAKWRAAGECEPPADLHRLLAARDPETAAALRPADRQRIVRALEVLEATGRPLSAWQRLPGVPVLGLEETLPLVVTVERAALYARADERFVAMVGEGALDEVAALSALGLDPALPAMRALGVAPLARHLAGALSLEAAVAAGQQETRQYIKRQLTWLRRHMIAWMAVAKT